VSKKDVDVTGVTLHYYTSWRCSGKFGTGKWEYVFVDKILIV